MTFDRTLTALLTLALAPSVLGSVGAEALEAQSASDFLAEARHAYEARMAGIEEYSVTSRANDVEHTTRYVRTEVDGSVVFLPESVGTENASRLDPGSLFRPEVAQRIRLEGSETVGGAECRVLVLDDFEGLDFAQAWSQGQQQVEPKRMTMCVDPDDYLLRRVVVEATGPIMGETRDITNTMNFTDYRDVEGLMHPFRIEVSVAGLPEMGALMGTGGENPAVEQLRSRLDQVPEAQRKALEEMLARMEALQAASAAPGGPTMLIETTSVEVRR